MKKSLFLVLLFISFHVMAQDRVKLTNGTVVRGKIELQAPNDNIILRSDKGELITIPAGKVLWSATQGQKRITDYDLSSYYQNRGGYFLFETGWQSNLVRGSITPLRFVGGMQLNYHIAVGLGAGVDLLGSDMGSFPLFFNFHYYPLGGKTSPYIGANLGWTLSEEERFAGLFGEVLLGYSFRLGSIQRLNISMAYTWQLMPHKIDNHRANMYLGFRLGVYI